MDLDILACTADDRLLAAVALAHRLLEVLASFCRDNHARLLYLAGKAAEQTFGRLLRVFLGYLNHIW